MMEGLKSVRGQEIYIFHSDSQSTIKSLDISPLQRISKKLRELCKNLVNVAKKEIRCPIFGGAKWIRSK